MSTLNIASKANQASTLPALLVAHYAKECDQSISIGFKVEDVDSLEIGDKATIELVQESGTSTFGCDTVIDKLISAYPFLQDKNENIVSLVVDDMQNFVS